MASWMIGIVAGLVAMVLATGMALDPTRTATEVRELADAGRARWIEVLDGGEEIAFERVPAANSVVLRFASNRGYRGDWQGEVESLGPARCRVRVTERATTPNPLLRVVGRLVFDPEAFAARYLEDLAAEVRRREGGSPT